MNENDVFELASKLISFPSVTGEEQPVVDYLQRCLSGYGLSVERIPVDAGRDNLFVRIGRASIVFATHLDVVPAPESMFEPRIEGGKLYGRGACDAKGIAATMIVAARQLLADGATDFGLLFLVGEETDSKGAKAACQTLRDAQCRFIVDGEPTEGKVVTGHKGHVAVRMQFAGKACHSGYPECGEDANAKLIRCASQILSEDFGVNARFGKSTANIGTLQGGRAQNIVSDAAELRVVVRTVGDNDAVVAKLCRAGAQAQTVDILSNSPCVKLVPIPGLESTVAAFGSDIPYLQTAVPDCVLYGPGSIHVAHTSQEYLALDDVTTALKDYRHIYYYLKGLL